MEVLKECWATIRTWRTVGVFAGLLVLVWLGLFSPTDKPWWIFAAGIALAAALVTVIAAGPGNLVQWAGLGVGLGVAIKIIILSWMWVMERVVDLKSATPAATPTASPTPTAAATPTAAPAISWFDTAAGVVSDFFGHLSFGGVATTIVLVVAALAIIKLLYKAVVKRFNL